jgi:hypothetical protein
MGCWLGSDGDKFVVGCWPGSGKKKSCGSVGEKFCGWAVGLGRAEENKVATGVSLINL